MSLLEVVEKNSRPGTNAKALSNVLKDYVSSQIRRNEVDLSPLESGIDELKREISSIESKMSSLESDVRSLDR